MRWWSRFDSDIVSRALYLLTTARAAGMGHTRMMGITRVMSVREMMAALTSAYPVDGPNGYHCPLAYPKKLITLQFETVYATYD
jgi:hypothetical protein